MLRLTARLLMMHAVNSEALFYQPTVGSNETDLYWYDLSGLTDISRDGKALLFLKPEMLPAAARTM
jgi:hypothetical protein